MKREHFEWLWKTERYIPGPELSGISPEIYKDWEKNGIIGNRFTHKVRLPSDGFNGLPLIRGNPDDDEYYIFNPKLAETDQSVWEFFETTQAARKAELVELYAVNHNQLRAYIANKWKFEPDWRETKHGGSQIGRVEGDVPVVILSDALRSEGWGALEAEEIKKHLEATRLLLIAMKYSELDGSDLRRLNAQGIVYLGIRDFITDDGQLKRDLQTVMSQVSPLLSTPWRIGGELEPIIFDGNELELQRIHHNILRTLLLNYPETVSRSELKIAAWDAETGKYYQDRNLTDQVSKLKKRALPSKASAWIKTEWGVGYRIRRPS